MHEGLVNVLAGIGAVSCLIWLVKAFKALIARNKASGAVAEITSAGPAGDHLAAITAVVYAIVGPHRIIEITAPEPANDDLAAITAAVYAVVATPHRIVHIENGSKAQTWAAEGRWMHQTSHRPH